MPLHIASIASGSNGNCYYVGNRTEAVLVDAGISCREVVRRAARTGIDMEKVKAIFISHEHSDHIRGLEAIARKWNLPVYATAPCLCRCGLGERSAHLGVPMRSDETISVGSLRVTAFAKRHDACDPVSFVVEEADGTTVGVFTDIGRCCNEVVRQFSRCHAAFLESNYDHDMLTAGRYPAHLKSRIRGGRGHLSNEEALTLFLEHASPSLSHLILSHLSAHNNDPQLVRDTFGPHRGQTEIIVASRYEESAVYTVGGSGPAMPRAAVAQRADVLSAALRKGKKPEAQLKLF